MENTYVRPPGVIKSVSRTFTFMLSDYNGRLPMERALAREFSSPDQGPLSTLTCMGCTMRILGPSYNCEECSILCEICVRTRIAHRGHESKTQLVKTRHAPARTVHPGSYCNICKQSPLTYPYYHCLTCEDFDICASCDALGDKMIMGGDDLTLDHDPTHATIKVRVPAVPKPFQ